MGSFVLNFMKPDIKLGEFSLLSLCLYLSIMNCFFLFVLNKGLYILNKFVDDLMFQHSQKPLQYTNNCRWVFRFLLLSLLSCSHLKMKLLAKFCDLNHKILLYHDLLRRVQNVHKHNIDSNICFHEITVWFEALIWNWLGYFMISLKMHFSQMACSHPIRTENVSEKHLYIRMTSSIDRIASMKQYLINFTFPLAKCQWYR